MAFQPVTRRSLTDEVFGQLVAGIVSGELAPGAPLPSERRLAEALGVSRPAVREALQRLAQSNLVEVRQGDGTTVRDYRRHAGPELLGALLIGAGGLDGSVVRSVVEVRSLLGPEVARLAAERGTAAVADSLDGIVARMGDDTDAVTLQHHALAFWDLLVDASGNIALRLLFNALRRAYEPAVAALAHVLADEVTQTARYAEIAAAVRIGDGTAAREQARALLDAGAAGIAAALDRLGSPPVP